jgi:FMN-dependent NADH-azoreductase
MLRQDRLMTLFVNSCVRKGSRTKRLAGILLGKLGGEIEEINVSDITFPTVDEEFLKKRDGLIASNKWDDPLFKYARQFAEADQIVIAAPYWDLSFPAALKQYFEQINVIGITFEYSPEGTPISKCRAEKLYYVTTAGGTFVPEDYGFGYVKALAQGFYGIQDVRLIKATGLDIYGADVEGIMQDAIASIDSVLQ